MCSVQVHAVLAVRMVEWSTIASCWEAKLPASHPPPSFLCYVNLLVCLLLLGAQLYTWRVEDNLISLVLAHLYTGPGSQVQEVRLAKQVPLPTEPPFLSPFAPGERRATY